MQNMTEKQEVTGTADYFIDPTLSAQQHHILSLIAEGISLTVAAERLGIHRNTIRNWRRNVPGFASEMESAIREQADAWREQAVIMAPAAAKNINDLLTDPNTPPAIRLRVSLAILKIASEPPSKPKTRPASHVEVLQPEMIRPKIVQLGKSENVAQSCTTAPIRLRPEPGRNTICPCGSGMKFKRCCSQKSPQSASDLRTSACIRSLPENSDAARDAA